MSRRRTAALLVVLALSTGCGGGDELAAPPSPPPATDPVPTPVEPVAGCPEGDVEDAVCRFVTAVQADDLDSLSELEREVAGSVGEDLPDGTWAIRRCELAGDITVLCELSFDASPQTLGFHLVPVNAEYVDGALVTPEGEPVRYEVEGYLGTGEPGSFGPS